MSDGKKFTLTEQHVKLLRTMYVGWQDVEFGAPEIDPKRPYGNSDVLGDIHEALTGTVLDDPDEMPRALAESYRVLHRETQDALQVVLVTGSFEPGDYAADEYRVNWHPAAESETA